ncbi:thioredoxin domain-containing protein [Gordonia otitidis]|uniref:DsbA family protein n=1 Tax=Gordonia otitidis TaxID=249058 RepID=UPI001D136FE8|nr:thioredoxin domain-containing protein [Gordonia otitidis]UEA57519.1 thioredoxin domain-containing protein [Gordonia otitidis]
MTLTPSVGSDDYTQGPDEAAITLVEYGDYECSYCGQAYPIVKDLQRTYSDSLRFCFRNFPIPEIHPQALSAAEFAEYAGSQGRFWEAHDRLYENQDRLGDSFYRELAAELGFEQRAVENALNAGEFADRIQGHINSGLRSGVNGTPAFFINEQFFPGPYTELPEVLAQIFASGR